MMEKIKCRAKLILKDNPNTVDIKDDYNSSRIVDIWEKSPNTMLFAESFTTSYGDRHESRYGVQIPGGNVWWIRTIHLLIIEDKREELI